MLLYSWLAFPLTVPRVTMRGIKENQNRLTSADSTSVTSTQPDNCIARTSSVLKISSAFFTPGSPCHPGMLQRCVTTNAEIANARAAANAYPSNSVSSFGASNRLHTVRIALKRR